MIGLRGGGCAASMCGRAMCGRVEICIAVADWAKARTTWAPSEPSGPTRGGTGAGKNDATNGAKSDTKRTVRAGVAGWG